MTACVQWVEILRWCNVVLVVVTNTKELVHDNLPYGRHRSCEVNHEYNP